MVWGDGSVGLVWVGWISVTMILGAGFSFKVMGSCKPRILGEARLAWLRVAGRERRMGEEEVC